MQDKSNKWSSRPAPFEKWRWIDGCSSKVYWINKRFKKFNPKIKIDLPLWLLIHGDWLQVKYEDANENNRNGGKVQSMELKCNYVNYYKIQGSCHQWSTRPDPQSRQKRTLLSVVLLDLRIGDGRTNEWTDGRTTCVKTMIPTGQWLWVCRVDQFQIKPERTFLYTFSIFCSSFVSYF